MFQIIRFYQLIYQYLFVSDFMFFLDFFDSASLHTVAAQLNYDVIIVSQSAARKKDGSVIRSQQEFHNVSDII